MQFGGEEACKNKGGNSPVEGDTGQRDGEE